MAVASSVYVCASFVRLFSFSVKLHVPSEDSPISPFGRFPSASSLVRYTGVLVAAFAFTRPEPCRRGL